MAGFPTLSLSEHDIHDISLNINKYLGRIEQILFKKCILKETGFQWFVTGRCRGQPESAEVQVDKEMWKGYRKCQYLLKKKNISIIIFSLKL